jgi:hypothetical protein
MCMVLEHLLPIVGRQAYSPSLLVEQLTGEGSPGKTKGLTGVVADP